MVVASRPAPDSTSVSPAETPHKSQDAGRPGARCGMPLPGEFPKGRFGHRAAIFRHLRTFTLTPALHCTIMHDMNTRSHTLSVRVSEAELSALRDEAKQLDRSLGWTVRSRLFPAETNTSGPAFGVTEYIPGTTRPIVSSNISTNTQADTHIATAPDHRPRANNEPMRAHDSQKARDDILRGVNRKSGKPR